MFIDCCARFGLVWNRKRGTRMWEAKKEEMKNRAATEGKEIVESLEGPPMFRVRKIEFVAGPGPLPSEGGVVAGSSEVASAAVAGGRTGAKINNPNPKSSPDPVKNKPSRFTPTKSPSSGSFDHIQNAETWAKMSGLTKESVMSAIPKRLKERYGLISALYLLRDFLHCAIIYFVFTSLAGVEEVRVPKAVKHYIPAGLTALIGSGDVVESVQEDLVLSLAIPTLLQTNTVFYLLFWSLYAVCMGTAATGLWVVGHECGHGAFSGSNFVNDAVGFVVHTLLLVPYFAWQFTHNKHHKYTNHVLLGETHVPKTKPDGMHKLSQSRLFRALPHIFENLMTLFDVMLHLVLGWPMYIIVNLTGGRVNWRGAKLNRKSWSVSHFVARKSEIFPPNWHARINLSALGFFGLVTALAVMVWDDANFPAVTFNRLMELYLCPILVTNAWLVGEDGVIFVWLVGGRRLRVWRLTWCSFSFSELCSRHVVGATVIVHHTHHIIHMKVVFVVRVNSNQV